MKAYYWLNAGDEEKTSCYHCQGSNTGFPSRSQSLYRHF